MKKPEVTSKRVAKIAAKVMSIQEPLKTSVGWTTPRGWEQVSVGDMKALAASCLTQAADKPKATRKRGGR